MGDSDHSSDPSVRLEELIDESVKVKRRAYCPYSKFPVGAAVLGCDGRIYTGCNVECAVYPLTMCAERNAITKAVSEGCKKFTAVVITSDLKNSIITPCGACRQIIAEFGMDAEVYMTKSDRSYTKLTLRELLPLGFGPDSLQEEKIIVNGAPIPTIQQ
ncbi:hypothetical protein CAPTEDRAFT_211995 [Capitella teleta]|uniref:Cytidine deaminase n=1 Tax=Capitella teleta TaxID=283909 RepID=R7TX65_CAPTE|nr:hypothetical protein CAPTEDRAFT_211995 [Capitella teleta]|eukprot:ELT96041.1 hypothetical protein CAPTEDRAFT_211995 [Capitella teleta]